MYGTHADYGTLSEDKSWLKESIGSSVAASQLPSSLESSTGIRDDISRSSLLELLSTCIEPGTSRGRGWATAIIHVVDITSDIAMANR